MILILLTVAVILLLLATHITNPFSRLSIVQQPFLIKVSDGEFHIMNENHRIVLRQGWFWRRFAYIKCGLHTLGSRYVHSPSARSSTIDGIIADIHAHRFRPDKLLLISGDHFNAMFVRNLGVFYYPMLDTRIKSTAEDWQDRQIVYIQTLAYALGVFEKLPIPVTTIVTTGAYAATCINIATRAYPSDSVYGMLYALAALLGKESATPDPGALKPHHTLETRAAAKQLLKEYREVLRNLYDHYKTTVYDTSTGLIRADIHLSGAKDITERNSAFYDNVIFWKTAELAVQLGLIPDDQNFRVDLKRRIIQKFWLEDQGYFLEDLSDEGITHCYYSSDWLIVLVTGFLSPSHVDERMYFERSVAYIQRMGIDQPFAIKYQHERRAHRQFVLARIAMAEYGGDAIWSFWGMEYIKTLLLLYQSTGNKRYADNADHHIAAYEQSMLKNRGFPEVYDHAGVPLKTWYYRSIRQTGWVIGFEQVRAMRAGLRIK
jgi:hypothetical protein